MAAVQARRSARPGQAPSARPVAADCALAALFSHFRCPPFIDSVAPADAPSGRPGFFRFGGAIGYGRLAGDSPAERADGLLPVAAATPARSGATLPFDLAEVVDNLRRERYARGSTGRLAALASRKATRELYYRLRPALPITVRKYVQRLRWRGWRDIPFPRWPVETSVEGLMRGALATLLRLSGVRELPFIWFWPGGARACATMTHDVEGHRGMAFADRLMDLDDEHGVKAAFQLVPAGAAKITDRLVQRFRGRGFEVNIHDLNHDGHLFRDRQTFQERAARINEYVRAFGCRGFRAGSMYRKQEWLDALDVSYDMSVPNVAHLEPQQGGCCTVFPYFVGDVLELPLTTAQDYTLFHVLGDYSIDLWKQQIEIIAAQNGFISFIVHPDYVADRRALAVYKELLAHLAQCARETPLWLAMPGEVDSWWRHRQQMRLVEEGGRWRVEGPDSARARVAWASIESGRLTLRVEAAA